MIIKVLSKNQFDLVLTHMLITNDNVNQHLDKAFISITNDNNSHYFNKDYKNVLNLEFDDASDEEKELVLFTEEQAEKIFKFAEENKSVETLYVHCLAGRSRSGAIGLVMNDYYGEETYMQFINNNPYITPNYFIVALLRRIYNKIIYVT